MIFKTQQIKGQGRGHQIGFPTINLAVPDTLVLDEGVYASWVTINDVPYKGALHYGAVPTFDQEDRSIEVFLLDETDETIPETHGVVIEVDIVEYIREVKKFSDSFILSDQIAKDVSRVRSILS
ncbi:MAG: riboflavin kinase [Candidatus Paceibacterota bacterium]